jgi:uncharacterized protein (TIGR03067 family)
MNCVTILSLAVVVAAPLPKDPPRKAEPPAIVGTWTCTSITDGGRPNSADVEGGLIFEFAANGTLKTTKNGKPEPDGSYVVDAAKSPTDIDLTPEAGGGIVRGIYKVEGDVLTLCFDDVIAGKRPTAFASPKGTSLLLITFKRLETKK